MKLAIQLLMFCSILIACNKSTSTDCVCTEEYNPVCGVDGKEYGNPCMAQCAGVTFTLGKCMEESLITYGGPIEVDGCGWRIQIGTEFFVPKELNPSFQIDSLLVLIKYNITNETTAVCWKQFKIIEILEIKRK